MCGRFGSTFTVCASPTCEVRPISLGAAGSVTSMISSPPCGASTIWPSVALVVAAAVGVGRVDDHLGVALDDERVRELRQRGALRARLGVVLEPGRGWRWSDRQVRRGVAGDVSRFDLAAVRQPDDVLPGAVWADPERPDGGVRLAVVGEEVEVRLRVPGRDRGDELPLGVLAARDERRSTAAPAAEKDGAGWSKSCASAVPTAASAASTASSPQSRSHARALTPRGGALHPFPYEQRLGRPADRPALVEQHRVRQADAVGFRPGDRVEADPLGRRASGAGAR